MAAHWYLCGRRLVLVLTTVEKKIKFIQVFVVLRDGRVFLSQREPTVTARRKFLSVADDIPKRPYLREQRARSHCIITIIYIGQLISASAPSQVISFIVIASVVL